MKQGRKVEEKGWTFKQEGGGMWNGDESTREVTQGGAFFFSSLLIERSNDKGNHRFR